MIRSTLAALLLFVPAVLAAQDDQIASAMRAAPESVSADATVVDWQMNTLREGTNGWTCLPDNPDSPGTDPWCVNASWVDFLHAYVSQSEPTYDQVGIAYMLMGDTPVSNTDPYATEKTSDEDWVEDLGAHLMILVPDHAAFESISTDPHNGGPWIMWPGTPYAHIMIPIDSYPPS
ncbi:MAG TPA: hypothetical protein VK837_14860 [Longimicrobiales bacterium]|nr:hypothetical protein [Longimicrobiales bacterium]